MSELISVIVPIYNIKEYLGRCIDSILAQTYQNIEVLMIDDGSTDGTSELVNKYVLKDSRIRVFHKANGGSSSARNLALREARGQYFSFIDSDDYIEPDMMEKLYQAIQTSGMPIAQGAREEIDEQGKILPDICIPPEKETVYESKEFMRELLLHKGDCSFCTKLTRASLFLDNGFTFPEGKLNEDFHVLVKMLPLIPGIVSIPKRMYHVFYKSGSNTRVVNEDAFSRVYGDNVDNAEMVLGIVDKKYPDLKNTALRFGYYQRLDYLLHIPISRMNKSETQYVNIVTYLRSNVGNIISNKELTKKQKLYLIVLAIMPKGARKAHRLLKKW
ncbi:MAG: glycosyltransferase family 2 protein [Lachnospiraceae bacterium]|nr:glycosyltransferase family 2 protein [Lachnospiraceae bacterium]